MQRILFLLAFALLMPICRAHAGEKWSLPPAQPALEKALAQPDQWFTTDAGKSFIDNLISWQNATGGWWKNYNPDIPRPADLPAPSTDATAAEHDREGDWRQTSTFDNGATVTELRLLARAYRIQPSEKIRESFDRGLKFVLGAQYRNGGFPQRFPLEDNYGRRITFNDRTMINILSLLREISAGEGDFAFVPPADRRLCKGGVARGVECILDCQIEVAGKHTGWAQQHDERIFVPVDARTYELASIAAMESADVVIFLMQLDDPYPRITYAIDSAVAWFETSRIAGKRYEKVTDDQGRVTDRVLVDDPDGAVWARFYDLETNKPFFCNRDGVKLASYADVLPERRAGYAWYGSWGKKVASEHAKWKNRTQSATTAPATKP